MTTLDQARDALRELAAEAHRSGRRSWAVIGDLAVPGEINEQVLAHDALSRLLVRLDITQLICVGQSRLVHGLHQGAIMEGSWGSESILVATPREAVSIVSTGIFAGPADTAQRWGSTGLATPTHVVTVLGGAQVGLWPAVAALLDGPAAGGPPLAGSGTAQLDTAAEDGST